MDVSQKTLKEMVIDIFCFGYKNIQAWKNYGCICVAALLYINRQLFAVVKTLQASFPWQT